MSNGYSKEVVLHSVYVRM